MVVIIYAYSYHNGCYVFPNCGILAHELLQIMLQAADRLRVTR